MATTVTVKPGDTLSAIAAKAGISLSSLLKLNPQITNPSLIKPGQKVNVPDPVKTPVKTPAPAGGTDSQNAARLAAAGGISQTPTPPPGAPKSPGKAWIWNGKAWAKPPLPAKNKVYTWNDETGYQLKSVQPDLSKDAPDLSTTTTPSDYGTFGYSVPGFALPTPTPTPTSTPSSDPYGGFGYSVPGGVGPNAKGTGSLSVTEDPKAPGKAWIWNGTSWVKPEKPFGDKTYTWSDDAGWVEPAATTTTTTTTTATPTEETGMSGRQSIITILTDRFNKYGLASLAGKIKELAIDGATEATITIRLQEEEEYKVRFSANTDRMNKGLKVLSPGEYLGMEDGYRQILRSYGLKQFDTDAYVKQFISNDVSAAELSDRVVTAVQRVQNADPAISQTLRDYYGIGSADMVAYVLDPNQQLQKIQRQVAAAEVGTAARRQGLEAGVQVSEQLAAQGVSEAEAQKGYSTIANILPTAEKLSEIYGGTMQKYGQTEGEQEVFNSLASAQRAREKLSAREIAQFQGSSGTMKSSLSSAKQGQLQQIPMWTYRPRIAYQTDSKSQPNPPIGI